MKILMMTNTYAPMVGGIEESIRSFSTEFIKLGHEVIIVAPETEGMPADEKGVVRLPAFQNVYNTNFSVALPISSLLTELMETFKPDIVHSNHPFWMGNIALRLCSTYQLPLVFTYHTMFEQHMHYLPTQNEKIKRFMVELFIGYANLANQVIAPSESVRDILVQGGVKTPIEVVPTGINLKRFGSGAGELIRKRFNIPAQARVIGHLGRLAEEKNIEYLCRCIAAYLKKEPNAHFLVAGTGPLEDKIKNIFNEQGALQRLHLAGVVHGQDLIDCYHAMDVFAFSSLSETQGIVLIEAMAAGVPVVAVDAPGVREVVKDGYNGRLLFQESRDNFVEALSWCLNQPSAEFQKLKQNARETTKEFSIELCAPKMLKVYQEIRLKEYVSPERKDSSWFSIVDRFKTEWDMFTNMLQAGAGAIADKPVINKPLPKKSTRLLARFPRLLSLSEWTGKLLNLSRANESEIEAGLVIIQIDGLSRAQLKTAFDKNEMPFLKGLYKKEFYKLHPFYPGVPSSTPSIQGELLYGIKQIVPAFSFLDKETSKVFRMYDSENAVEIERRLAAQGKGLLEGGSSYSNIFSGGAKESHFCANILGWGELWNNIRLVNSIILIITHIPFFVRMAALILWEIVLGITQFVIGILKGENFIKEWHFIYLRPLICIFLREFVVFGSKIDIMRGLPIIHLNLLGYDELSHNSGPSSKSAHWALKGIDGAIENIYRTALHAPRRNYDVWIYSDHGQEETVPYVKQHGRNVHEAIAEVFKNFYTGAECVQGFDKNGEQLHRARFLGFSFIGKIFRETAVNNNNKAVNDTSGKKLVVTAFGPTGNIYLPLQITNEQKHKFALELVEKAGIPVVLLPEEQGVVHVWTKEGEFVLPKDAAKIIGAQHPYLKEVTDDLISLCHHSSAGDFTFMGHKPGHKPMSFPIEHGSHAGPGMEETNAFALLPVDALKIPSNKKYLTPMDLRLEALRFLKRFIPVESIHFPAVKKVETAPASDTLRVLTYNVHSCVGLDGKFSPERIARVISRHEPDIVALQELDVFRARTGKVDQPQIIAEQLKMIYHFHPSFQIQEERYGNAVLSRYPMELIRSGRLAGGFQNPKAEQRGAIWSTINIAGTKINFVNTHLGIFPWERGRQIKDLLGSEWIGHPQCVSPVILCGDFNSLPGSRLYRHVNRVLRDAQRKLDNHNPQATWFGHYPIGRIDHVFVSPEIEIVTVKVSRTDLDKISSDHLPLIVDIKLNNI